MTLTLTKWYLIRLLLLFLFSITLLLIYSYTIFVPPGELYSQLFEAEVQDSKKLIYNERGNKYVKFRQLQGAGFNNQVRPFSLENLLFIITVSGTRDSPFSSSCIANVSYLRLSAFDMASSW